MTARDDNPAETDWRDSLAYLEGLRAADIARVLTVAEAVRDVQAYQSNADLSGGHHDNRPTTPEELVAKWYPYPRGVYIDKRWGTLVNGHLPPDPITGFRHLRPDVRAVERKRRRMLQRGMDHAIVLGWFEQNAYGKRTPREAA